MAVAWQRHANKALPIAILRVGGMMAKMPGQTTLRDLEAMIRAAGEVARCAEQQVASLGHAIQALADKQGEQR